VAHTVGLGLALATVAYGKVQSLGVRIDRVTDNEQARAWFYKLLDHRSEQLAAGTASLDRIPEEVPIEVIQHSFSLTRGMTTVFDPNPNGPLSDLPDVVAAIFARGLHTVTPYQEWLSKSTGGNPQIAFQDYTADLKRKIVKPWPT